jgi:hypothetical protein
MNFLLLAEIALKRIKPLAPALCRKKRTYKQCGHHFYPVDVLFSAAKTNLERVNWLIQSPVGRNDYQIMEIR